MSNQVQHCLEQIVRFGGMLATGEFGDRSRDATLAQLFFNLGRYVELTDADGRSWWRQYESALARGDYAGMAATVAAELAKL